MEGDSDESANQKQILIADDDQAFRSAVEIWLSEYNDSEITTVTNGADAVETVDSTYSVFLCDRRMPKLNGNEVIERVNERGHDVPTIVLSAIEPDPELSEDEVELYLQKPIDRDELLEAIDQVY